MFVGIIIQRGVAMKRITLQLIISIAFLIPALHLGATDRIADIESRSDSISFYPQVSYAQLELTVAGGDVYWQQRYGEGEIATFSIFDEVLSDGFYRFELVASPPYDKEAWEMAKKDMALKRDLEVIERSETYKQTGRFEVVDGQIVILADGEES